MKFSRPCIFTIDLTPSLICYFILSCRGIFFDNSSIINHTNLAVRCLLKPLQIVDYGIDNISHGLLDCIS